MARFDAGGADVETPEIDRERIRSPRCGRSARRVIGSRKPQSDPGRQRRRAGGGALAGPGGEPGGHDGGDRGPHRRLGHDAEDGVHVQVIAVGDAGRRQAQLHGGIGARVDLGQRGHERSPAGEIGVVGAGVGNEQVLEQPPGVAGGGLVQHGERDGPVGGADGDDVGDARRGGGDEPRGVAGAAMRRRASWPVPRPAKASTTRPRRALWPRVPSGSPVASRQASRVPNATNHSPAAGTGALNVSGALFGGCQVDDALGRGIGEQIGGAGRHPDVQCHRGYVVEQILEVERVEDLAGGHVLEGDDLHAGGRVQRRDDAPVATTPAGDDAVQASGEVTVPDEIGDVRGNGRLGFEPCDERVGREPGIARAPADELLAGLREQRLGTGGREPDRQGRAGPVARERQLEGSLGGAVAGRPAGERTAPASRSARSDSASGPELADRRSQPRRR